MNEYKTGSILLGGYIVTGDGRDTGICRQYPCIGPAGGKNTVAVYEYSKECADAIEKRMAAWKALSHPGVPTPVKYGWENGCFMVAVEQDICTMPPLSDKRYDAEFYPKNDNTPCKLPTYEGLKRLLKSAELLGYLASQDFVCGGVSPDTMLYGEECMYLNELPLLPGGYIPAYCSIEQMEGKALTDKTDVYSWAVSVMALYLGELPWPNGAVAGLNCAEYLGQAERTRGLPDGLRRLLERCLNAEPEGRPDWTEIVETLRGWIDEAKLPWKKPDETAFDPNKTVLEQSDHGDAVSTAAEETAISGNTTPDGKYRIGRQLELEPPFDIYEAVEVKSGKAVTLLRLDENSRSSEANRELLFKRYVNSICAASGGRPNENRQYIALWYDPSCRDSDIDYLICDSQYGQSLTAWLRQNKPVDETLALLLTLKLLAALDTAHRRGCKYMGQGDFCECIGPALVHRSVSAENIRIIERENESPHLLLDGFDTALPAHEDAGEQYCGAPGFSSRWQLINASRPDPAWDVWAAAACLYYMLTGKYPRPLSSDMWNDLLKNRPTPILEYRPDLSPALAAVIDRALDDFGGLHYATAEELLAALTATKA